MTKSNMFESFKKSKNRQGLIKFLNPPMNVIFLYNDHFICLHILSGFAAFDDAMLVWTIGITTELH